MNKLQVVVSNQYDPFLNRAVEQHLTDNQEEGMVTMYLWKNQRTVVIGYNQNPYSECNVKLLLNEGGHLMRRGTGGGAVYHDLGNINFSFIADKKLYDVRKQLSVIQDALLSYGLQTEISGRNDLTCQGRKFSGNAFSRGQHNCLHHGTLLISGDMSDLARYLKPKPAKLQKHGVQSVRSRVVNLSELNPGITPDSIVPRLRAAFELEYSGNSEYSEYSEIIKRPEVRALYEQFASPEWKYGRWRTFTAQRSAQFDWGGVELSLTIDNDVITEVQLASDALDRAALDESRRLLTGADTKKRPPSESAIVNDILSLVY